MKTTFRTKVFKMAYHLVKATGKKFSVCLSWAWEIYRFIKQLKLGVITFAYEKVDGTLRKAKGTLKSNSSHKQQDKKENYKTVRYFDVEADGLRSFKIENLITVY